MIDEMTAFHSEVVGCQESRSSFEYPMADYQGDSFDVRAALRPCSSFLLVKPHRGKIATACHLLQCRLFSMQYTRGRKMPPALSGYTAQSARVVWPQPLILMPPHKKHTATKQAQRGHVTGAFHCSASCTWALRRTHACPHKIINGPTCISISSSSFFP